MNKILASREHYTNTIVRTLAEKNKREERNRKSGVGSVLIVDGKELEWEKVLKEYRKTFKK